MKKLNQDEVEAQRQRYALESEQFWQSYFENGFKPQEGPAKTEKILSWPQMVIAFTSGVILSLLYRFLVG